ncbi:MAG: uracil-DNA glycosylase [Endomicrobium sp.]|jgi:DNA polymerase|nr:uracil-DNA glycosylase [Endomicrobium sp.]
MKLSKYLTILKFIKKSLEEYINWGEDEIYKIPVTNIESYRISKSKEKLELLKKKVNTCRNCFLGKSRLKTVFGTGSPNANIMFIGEGPGYDEDHKGEPFVGRAGQLLTKIIEAMGQTRKTVYISNIVKCHPMIDPHNPEKRSNDRPPSFEEIKACMPYLNTQIEIIMPKIIVTLGAYSTKSILNLNIEEPMRKIRGNFNEYNGIKLMPTYHPSALLRNPTLKKFVWEDMKKVIRYLDTDKI